MVNHRDDNSEPDGLAALSQNVTTPWVVLPRPSYQGPLPEPGAMLSSL